MDVSQNKVEIVTGAFWKELPETINYEGTIPLTYSMNRVNGFASSNNKGITLGCTGVSKEKWLHCDLLTKVEKLSDVFKKQTSMLEQLAETGENVATYTETKRSAKRSLDFIGEFGEWCCGLATQHKLDKIVMNENELESQIKKLQNGLSDNLKIFGRESIEFEKYINKSADTFTQLEHHIHSIETFANKFTWEYTKELNGVAQSLLVVLYQNYLNLKRTIYLTYLMEENEIITTCKQHQIPQAILTPAIFLEDLKKLSNHIASSGFGLAIPEPDVARYYQLPICDCTVVKKKITIHVRVPISHIGGNWKLYELITTPFAWFNRTCKINHENLYLAALTNSDNREIRTVSGSGLHQCKPYHDKLCYLPRFSADTTHGPTCARKLFLGSSVQELSHHCPMSCYESTATTITEVEENVFVVTHVSPDSKVKCMNQETKLSADPHQPGAQKIRIPCSCEFIVNNEILVPKKFPCKKEIIQELTVTHILPVTWSKVDPSLRHNSRSGPILTFETIHQPLNTNWTLEIPHINISSTKTTVENIRRILEEEEFDSKTFSDKYGVHSNTLFWIWNIALSLATVYLLRRNPAGLVLANAPIVNGYSDTNPDFIHELFLGFMGISVLIFLLVILWKLFFATRRKRNTGQEAPRQVTRNATQLEARTRQILVPPPHEFLDRHV